MQAISHDRKETQLRTRILTIAVVAGMAASMLFGGTAFAGSPNHAEPGTPGEKNCKGQSMAYLAQLGPSAGVAPGIGNLPDATGLTMDEIKQAVEDYCAAP
jgi:hypothetical protein